MRCAHLVLSLSLAVTALPTHAEIDWNPPFASKCDINNDGFTGVSDVQSMINQALGIASPANPLVNGQSVTAADVQTVINAALNLGCAADVVTGAPAVTDFNPKSGPAGTVVTLTGGNFGASPQVSMPQQGGGTISLPLSGMTSTSLAFVIASGTASGAITVFNGAQNASTGSSFTVTAANTFSLTASPASVTLIQGQSVAYAVQLNSSDGFNQLAQLNVSGVPSGVTSSFGPPSISSGQTSVLTLTAPSNQPAGTVNISVSASAVVGGIPVSQAAPASLSVAPPTTSLLGRTVVADPLQTPLAGVTVKTLGLDGNGNTTSCTGFSTVSDAAGNFALTNLPLGCTGPQLISFNGTTVTSPAGQYAGVNLVFTLTSGQVTVSPVLVHLPRIDNVETFMVEQNAGANQSYSFTTIPGLSVTVYAGTTFTMADGTQPNPFPLAAVQVPVDRLPDLKPNVPTMVRVFIVAFQPANTVASQPVAVSFPNVSNTPPGTDMPLMTLDPTHGTMVPYGTGAVSADGTQVVPDADPMHPGHLYGLVHFDWHGQMPEPQNQSNPCPDQCNAPTSGDPVDLSSGLQIFTTTDILVRGARGSIAVKRVYRTLSTYNGAFGPGHEIQYAWQLNTGAPASAKAINLIRADGNQFLFSRQANGTLTNSSIPWLHGAVMTTNGGNTSLRFLDGTVYKFVAFAGVSYLSTITDRNGNVTTFTVVAVNATTLRITKITDPVGRSLNLTYGGDTHLAQVTDPLGRTVSYSYNAAGTLATMTDPNGGVTRFQYDAQNRMTSMIDPRGVTMFQDTYDANGRVSQQVSPDGAVFQYAYTVANSLVATSPVISTTVTDALGNQSTYRFNIQGLLTDVTDALGQTKSFTLAPGTNLVTEINGPAQCEVCGPPGMGTVSYTYDADGNVLTSTDSLGNVTTLTYDPTFNQITSITDPQNHTARFTYDGSGNLTVLTDAGGNATKFAYDTTGLLTQVTDALGNITKIGRDALGNANSLTDALGNVTTTTFDSVSRPQTVVDPFGRQSTYAFDNLDRVTSNQDPLNYSLQFAYDAVGNLLSLTDTRGNVTRFTYDTLSRLLTRTSPLGKTESYQYDLNGNITQYTDRRGQANQFQYDVLNRLVKQQYQDGSVVNRTYDPYSRLLTVTDTLGGSYMFGYDANGSLISQTEPNGAVQYTRDALSRVVTSQVAGQNPVTYTYDPAGNLLTSSSSAAGVTYSYDARNLPATLARTNGVNSAFTFDPLGQLTSLVHAKGGAALNTQTYGYDAMGNLVSASNDLAQPLLAQSAAMTVDQANELLSNGPTSYTQDLNGNRITETNPASRLTYAWDSRNRLASITDGNGNRTAFKYDFGRNLIEIDKTIGGATAAQKFVYDNLTNVVSLTDSSGLPVAVLTGRSVDSHYASVDSSGNVDFGIGDLFNSVNGVLNGSGSVTSTAAYDPYGQSAKTPSVIYPFAYTGRIPVSDHILYSRFRFLDTTAGRFLSEDPADFLGGSANLYSYVGANPMAGTDPYGLWQFTLTIPLWWGLEGQITFGRNGGQWNVGAYAGIGVGAKVSFDPNDAGCDPESNEWGQKQFATIGPVGIDGEINTQGHWKIAVSPEVDYGKLLGLSEEEGGLPISIGYQVGSEKKDWQVKTSVDYGDAAFVGWGGTSRFGCVCKSEH